MLVLLALPALAAAYCRQVDLDAIKSTQITDYQTSEDELLIRMGVGDEFIFTLEHTIKKGQVWSFDRSVRFPCYSSEVVWIQVTEIDGEVDDQTRVEFDCSNLANEGFQFKVIVDEDSGAIQPFAQAT